MEVVTCITWPYHGMDHEAKKKREYVLQKMWQDCVADKFGRRDEIPPNALAEPKSVFSYAMTVMVKVDGWNEEKWVGSKFAACMWIHTKAAQSAGQGRSPEGLRQVLVIIMEYVTWVCEDLWEHEWVTEPNVLWKENEILEALKFDLDVPCLLQWGLLWFSSPSRLNRKFANDGTKIAKYRETVDMAIEITLTEPFEGLHTLVWFCANHLTKIGTMKRR